MRNSSLPIRPQSSPLPSIPMENILFFFHALHIERCSQSSIRLLNICQHPLRPLVAHADVRGAIGIYHPHGLSDSIRLVGGLKRLLPLVARAKEKLELRKGLVLLGMLLRDNPRNHSEIAKIQGYQLLKHTLKHRSILLDRHTANILCSLVGIAHMLCLILGLFGHTPSSYYPLCFLLFNLLSEEPLPHPTIQD